ncbi:hypothetical protein OIU84_022662 [Salix udensis]|uniref:Uncharacterized protein n=1 Tax=Salix udensis TaxID=889485 RepID=A0AAD6PFI4_9ROSI|nr:hypothetical protein OIU84_022662 [Salix udensis]
MYGHNMLDQSDYAFLESVRLHLLGETISSAAALIQILLTVRSQQQPPLQPLLQPLFTPGAQASAACTLA